MSKNRFGLSRNIPEKIKFQVRKNSGFGCVICGLGIYEYEHIEPEFKDAKEHIADNITLLCSQCHSKKTRKFLSKETILSSIKKPFSLKNGYVNEFLDINLDNPITILIGDSKFRNCPIPIRFKNKDIIRIEKSDETPNQYKLSCEFLDKTGKNSLKIENNEWIANSENWDIITKAGQLIIKNKEEIYLIIENVNNNTLFVKYYKSYIEGHYVEVNDSGIRINTNKFSLNSFDNCSIGMLIS